MCTNPTLTAAARREITITGTVAAGTAGQTIHNVATVSSNTADPDLTNNAATFTSSSARRRPVDHQGRASERRPPALPVTNPLAVRTFYYRSRSPTRPGPTLTG